MIGHDSPTLGLQVPSHEKFWRKPRLFAKTFGLLFHTLATCTEKGLQDIEEMRSLHDCSFELWAAPSIDLRRKLALVERYHETLQITVVGENAFQIMDSQIPGELSMICPKDRG